MCVCITCRILGDSIKTSINVTQIWFIHLIFLCNPVLSLRKSEPPALYYTGTVRTALSSRLARAHCTGPRDVKLLWLLQQLFSLWVRSLV